jgi:hypothetical protein
MQPVWTVYMPSGDVMTMRSPAGRGFSMVQRRIDGRDWDFDMTHYFMNERPPEDRYWAQVDRSAGLGFEWLAPPEKFMADPQYWKKQAARPDFRLYQSMDLMCVRGRLFKVDPQRIQVHCSMAEFEDRVRFATCYKVCKVSPVNLYSHLGRPCLQGKFGVYVAFFGSAWGGREGLFTNSVQLHSWLPCWRRCGDCLVYVQRLWRRRRAARKSLAVAMALHARLGEGAGISGLGQDLLECVCRFL